jgi:hypothetical protein
VWPIYTSQKRQSKELLSRGSGILFLLTLNTHPGHILDPFRAFVSSGEEDLKMAGTTVEAVCVSHSNK